MAICWKKIQPIEISENSKYEEIAAFENSNSQSQILSQKAPFFKRYRASQKRNKR